MLYEKDFVAQNEKNLFGKQSKNISITKVTILKTDNLQLSACSTALQKYKSY